MNGRFLTIAACLILLFTAAFAEAESKPTYKRYVNERFGYQVSYPEGLLIPQGEADNSDGQSFLSKERDVKMLVWGSYNVLDESLDSRFKEESKSHTEGHPDRQVTYKHRTGNTFVVSGYTGGKVFYQKTILNEDAFLSFSIAYPAAKKQVWDPIVAVIAKSFQ